jgi:microcystin-dependent protein
MATPYLSEIKLVSFNFPPKGWALCNGQILSIAQNQALFSLLGTTYGGDGRVNFALPNLQARAPIHMGNQFVIGETGGEADHTLTVSEMPAHAHQAQAVSTVANSGSPAGAAWADSATDPYAASANGAMAANAVLPAGGSQPHENMPPFLVLNYIIALTGIFPSRN